MPTDIIGPAGATVVRRGRGPVVRGGIAMTFRFCSRARARAGLAGLAAAAALLVAVPAARAQPYPGYGWTGRPCPFFDATAVRAQRAYAVPSRAGFAREPGYWRAGPGWRWRAAYGR
jgi:hypothetical protein